MSALNFKIVLNNISEVVANSNINYCSILKKIFEMNSNGPHYHSITDNAIVNRRRHPTTN